MRVLVVVVAKKTGYVTTTRANFRVFRERYLPWAVKSRSSPASGSWEVTVVKRIDEKNRIGTAGNTITSLEVRVKNVGTDELSIRATAFEAASPTRER